MQNKILYSLIGIKKAVLWLMLPVGLLPIHTHLVGQTNYLDYHKEANTCEQFISESRFKEALTCFNALFDEYDFVFLRDVKVATQLAVFLKDRHATYKYIRRGISTGWSLKDLRKEDFYASIKAGEEWQHLLAEYDAFHDQYLQGIDQELRTRVHDMFKMDQKKALRALFRLGQKTQDKYAENKFAPHSEQQLAELDKILSAYGYPGEQLIGNDWWASTILSHHNSISRDYVSRDTLYTTLRPKLLSALKIGEISPFEFALMEDWRTAVLNEHKLTSYGFLGKIPDAKILQQVNNNRDQIGLRSIELRNKLVEIQEETGMNFNLPGQPWQKGEIKVTGN